MPSDPDSLKDDIAELKGLLMTAYDLVKESFGYRTYDFEARAQSFIQNAQDVLRPKPKEPSS